MPANVLISSAGRRVALMNLVRGSLAGRRPGAWVGASDSGVSAPAGFLASKFWRVPRCTHPDFESALLEICVANDIGLVVPTIDTELPVLARCRSRFEEAGIAVCVSGVRAIEIACDKKNTHSWLLKNGFPTVRQASPSQAIEQAADWRWPLIAKPHDGSASVGVQRLSSLTELQRLAESNPAYIVQEMARGREFTVNLYVSRSGQCICAVPHWRMEVRAGEVSKGVTVKDPALMELGCRVAEALPEARGPLNMQCFVDDDGAVAIIEINARFGGGYPLAHEAGAHFTDWLLDEQEGRQLTRFDAWMDDLAMLRYDDAVFVPGREIVTG